MAKFKVGDRVKILSGGYSAPTKCSDGDTAIIVYLNDRVGEDVYGLQGKDSGGAGQTYYWSFLEEELELVEPAEHPALTLAKAEVVRLLDLGNAGRTCCEDDALHVLTNILAAFGLEYRQKPAVPQPVEYEFAEISK
jgi:hypothetical protein